MDAKVIGDVLNEFSSGLIKEVVKTEDGVSMLIDMSEFKEHYHSDTYKCDLINCTQFQLMYKDKEIGLKDISKHTIELYCRNEDQNAFVIDCYIDENRENHAESASLYIQTETIRVYDELEKEVTLLDLAILGGLASSGEGICLLIGNTVEEADSYETMVVFNDALRTYLMGSERYIERRYKEKEYVRESFDLLLELDPYGYTTFSLSSIHELLNISESLREKYSSDHLDHQKVRYFALKLKEICLEAIRQNKLIVGIGD